jgi:energy-coupling factor transport system substrate-specific component
VLKKLYKKRTAMWCAVIIVCVAALVCAAVLGGRTYIIASIAILVCAMVPFFFEFEAAAPTARELVLVATFCALAIASRAAFAMFPNFKPVAGLCIIAGMALGVRNGFVVGALTMLLSNFIFGQGTWTPWQMFAFGLCGLCGGALVKLGLLPAYGLSAKQKTALSVFGCALILLVVGPILDTSTLFFAMSEINFESAAAVYLAGVPFNAIHAAATFATLFLLANPILNRVNRLFEKYGMSVR